MTTALTISARAGAVAWLNAFLAASQDVERPLLFRTLSLEFFGTGVQCIGCDGTALIRSFVPSLDGADWPDADEAPTRSVIVTDPDHFGSGFMRTLFRITNDDAHQGEPLTLSTMIEDDGAAPALGEAFRRERLTLRSCGQRIDLQLMEATYPAWRQLNLGISPAERVHELRVAPRLFGMLGRLKAVTALDLTFHGTDKHIGFAGQGLVGVRGVIMPMRKPDEQAKPSATEKLVEAVAALAPAPGSGIDSVTISSGGQSATLHQGDGERIRHGLGVVRGEKKK